MLLKDEVVHTLNELSERELAEVAQYVRYVKFRTLTDASSSRSLTDEQMRSLYQEAANEDRELANSGLDGYVEGLAREDKEG